MSSLVIQDAGILKSAETAQGLEPEVMGLRLGHPLIPSVSFHLQNEGGDGLIGKT